MEDSKCAETAPQPVIQPEPWGQDAARIRHEVTSIRILLVIALVIFTAALAGSLVIQAETESNLNAVIHGSSPALNAGYCVMGSC
jgi:hypothetical protein